MGIKVKLEAATPLRRIGLLLLGLALPTLIFSVIYWNITEKPFLYRSDIEIRIRSQKPNDEGNLQWRSNIHNDGWELWDENCLRSKRAIKARKFGMFANDPYRSGSLECLVEEIKDEFYIKQIWKSTLGEYLALNYVPWLLLLLIASALMTFGFIEFLTVIIIVSFEFIKDRVISILYWIRTGTWKKQSN